MYFKIVKLNILHLKKVKPYAVVWMFGLDRTQDNIMVKGQGNKNNSDICKHC